MMTTRTAPKPLTIDALEPFASRLLARVDRLDSGCWRWTGALNSSGYPVARVAGQLVLVHRVMCALAGKPLTTADDSHHTCHHRWCVQPAHLEPQPWWEHRVHASHDFRLAQAA
jgi:hypothetical protein